jgi:hypothetical protein
MLQVFYLDVTYVLVAIYICCKRLFKIFHLFHSYVASVLSTHVAVAIHMLQEYVANVSLVSDVCCKNSSCCNINIFVIFFPVFYFVGAGDGSADIYDSSIGLLGVENSYIHPYPLLFKYKGSHLFE